MNETKIMESTVVTTTQTASAAIPASATAVVSTTHRDDLVTSGYVHVGQPAPSNVIDLIGRMAADPNSDIDKFERLLAMKERLDKAEAERAYAAAMRAVQAAVPKVRKDKSNLSTNSSYASLETLNDAVIPIYTAHGFALSFGEGETAAPNCVRVTCDITHESGHTVHRFYDSPLDDKGIKGNVNKTPAHAKASAVAYGRRYLTLMIFNVTVGGEDDDGNGGHAEIEVISAEQTANLEALITEVNANRKAFLQHFKVERLDTLPVELYGPAVKALEQKRKAPAKAAA